MEELIALESNQTWELIPHPPNVMVICSKWVYFLKLKSDVSLDRCEADLIGQGWL